MLALVEGPYGGLGPYTSMDQESILLVAGGSGMGFTIGVLDEIVGRRIKSGSGGKISLVWAVRERGMLVVSLVVHQLTGRAQVISLGSLNRFARSSTPLRNRQILPSRFGSTSPAIPSSQLPSTLPHSPLPRPSPPTSSSQKPSSSTLDRLSLKSSTRPSTPLSLRAVDAGQYATVEMRATEGSESVSTTRRNAVPVQPMRETSLSATTRKRCLRRRRLTRWTTCQLVAERRSIRFTKLQRNQDVARRLRRRVLLVEDVALERGVDAVAVESRARRSSRNWVRCVFEPADWVLSSVDHRV